MNKGILYFLWYSLKYEIKRSYIFLGIIFLLYIFFSFGIQQQVSAGVNSVNLIDNDNSELSRNFTSYIKFNNITTNPESFNIVIIPEGFEESYNNRNATLKVGILGVGSNHIYEYQLYRLGEGNRIITKTQVLEQEIIILFLALLVIIVLISFFYESRISGKIYFITNHLSFWWYYALSNLILIISGLYFIIYGSIPLKILLLSLIIFLMMIILVFYQRNNSKLVQNINLVVYVIGALFVIGRIIGLKNYPLFDLMFKENSPIIFVDIGIFIILLYVVSRIKLTE